MSYKAIIFDFDGVLGDTMEDNYKAWAYACSKHDIPLQRKEYFMLEGLSVREVAKFLLDQYGVSLVHAEQLAQDKERYYRQHNDFSLYDGAIGLLKLLQKKAQLALVTGASKKRLEATLDSGFIDLFDAFITGDASIPSKPDPAPYLSAIKQLRIDPNQAVVVENAPLGIHAAKAAGLECLAISSTLSSRELDEADDVVDSLSAAGGRLMERIGVVD